MDPYGIGNAYRAMAMMYTQASRRTGRTTQMLDRLKNGDRVVCLESAEVHRLKRLCHERGLEVEFITCSPKDPGQLLMRGTPEGQSVFEHTWVERFFASRIEHLVEEFAQLQRDLSGYGEAHRETRRRAQERSGLYRFPGPSNAEGKDTQ